MMRIGSVEILSVEYDVYVAYGEDLDADKEGEFDPKGKRILVRDGARVSTYEHEELHAVFDTCGVTLLLKCEVKPSKKREELIVSILAPAMRSIKRSPELVKWLAG